MSKRKVLVTGACGTVAGLVLPALRERYDLVLLDVKTTNHDGKEVAGVQIMDLVNKDRDAYRHHFQGCDAIIHFAFVGNSNPSQSQSSDHRFWDEFANVQMAYNIYQTALEEKVRRVVIASSNHAADYYEGLIHKGKHNFVDPSERALSDNFYGWAKEVYEHLGFVFACGKQARPTTDSTPSTTPKDSASDTAYQLENVQLRIGGPRENDLERADLGDMRRVWRSLAVYISPRDMQQLCIKSIETEDIRDENGVPFQIFYGISGNSHAFWSIVNARKIIGYAPEDNSELKFADLLAKHIAAAKQKQP